MSSAKSQRERAAKLHRWTRLGVQIAFFILAPSLFSAAFNGVKYVFTQLGASAPLEMTSFLALFAGVVAFTVIFGRFFCGYACAFGTLGDVLYAEFELIRSKTRVPRPVFPQRLVRALSLVKYVVLFGICLACFAGVWSAVSGTSPWVSFAGLIGGSLEGIGIAAFVALGLVVVGMIVRERFFCQFLCPLGAIFSLLPSLGFSAFTRTRGHCAASCGRCHEACPVDIWPDAEAAGHGECISCGRCADACPLSNVNLVAVEKVPDADEAAAAKEGAGGARRPVRKTKQTWRLVRGTETGVVVVKALALMALCWALGATRFLPQIQEVFPWLS